MRERRKREFNGRERTEIRCDCRRWLLCVSHTNTCHCGREYNQAGQQLAPRAQWGAETGESAADFFEGANRGLD